MLDLLLGECWKYHDLERPKKISVANTERLNLNSEWLRQKNGQLNMETASVFCSTGTAKTQRMHRTAGEQSACYSKSCISFGTAPRCQQWRKKEQKNGQVMRACDLLGWNHVTWPPVLAYFKCLQLLETYGQQDPAVLQLYITVLVILNHLHFVNCHAILLNSMCIFLFT